MTPPLPAPRAVNCDGKDKIPTMNLARAIAKKMSFRKDVPVGAYKCPHCGAYHVGNNRTKNRFKTKFKGRPK